MSGLASPTNSRVVADACDSIHEWQKSISDHKYSEHSWNEQRWSDHSALLKAAMTSCADLADEVLRQVAEASEASSKIELSVIDELPQLRFPIKDHELANPNWTTDSVIHESFVAGGCTRSHASSYLWWHLAVLNLLRTEGLDDPALYLACSRLNTSNRPFEPHLSMPSHAALFPSDRKAVDNAVRELLRHCGGIYHRRNNWLRDCPIVAAWWRVEIATAAAEHGKRYGLTVTGIYNVLRESWPEWATKTVTQAPRLAEPPLVCAYVLAMTQNQTNDPDENPSPKQTIAKLMRRTNRLAVQIIDSHDLASLARWHAGSALFRIVSGPHGN